MTTQETLQQQEERISTYTPQYGRKDMTFDHKTWTSPSVDNRDALQTITQKQSGDWNNIVLLIGADSLLF